MAGDSQKSGHSSHGSPWENSPPGGPRSVWGKVIHRESLTKKDKERLMVPVVFIIFVIMRAMDKAFLNRVYKIMGPYKVTLMSLYWPVCIQIMVIFCISVFVLVQRRRGATSYGGSKYGLSWLSPFNPHASSTGPVPFYWMMLFSMFDQLNAVVQTVAQTFITASLQTVINNTATLWTALLCFIFLGSRFRQVHYAGCVLIVFSCVVGVIVELQTKEGMNPKDAAGNDVKHIPASTMVAMYFIFIAGVLPNAMSNTYKQYCLKSVDLDIAWATMWSGMWQVLWGILFYSINWVPYPLPHTPGSLDADNHTIPDHNTQSPSTLGKDLSDAWTCFSGENVSPGDSCSTDPAWVYFVIYLLFNLSFNLLFLWLTKYLSATWAVIGTVLCGDLYGVFNQWELIGGKGYEILKLEEWIALALSSVAMWVYNIEDERTKDGRSMYGVDQQQIDAAAAARAGSADVLEGLLDGKDGGERIASPPSSHNAISPEAGSPASSRHHTAAV